LPRYELAELFRARHGVELPQDFQTRKHGQPEARGR
jgi:hypothetical protein